MTVLPISLTIAGAAALINFWLASRVGRLRRAAKVAIGDGGDEALAARMRAQSNFTEYTPIFLILLALVELASESPAWLWAVAALFIVGRILHAFGMDRRTINPLRTAGMVLTLLMLIGLALYAIAIPYLERSRQSGISYAAAPQAPASTASATNGFDRRS
jgi:uncharacterized protein